MAGVGLGQFGEFGFVLVQLGESSGLVSAEQVQPLLAAGILSMFLTPVITRLGPHITAGEKVLTPLTRILGGKGAEELNLEEKLSDHVVVIGYGLAGRLMGTTLTECGVPFVALELNADTVRTARAEGAPVYYADATSIEALEHANVSSSRGVAVLINDRAAVERVAEAVRRVDPSVPLLIRTRFQSEQEILRRLGATEVIAEEVEASVEALARMLRSLSVPINVIDREVRLARERLSTSSRDHEFSPKTLGGIPTLNTLGVESVLMEKGGPALGRSLDQLNLREGRGALVIALKRGGTLLFLLPTPEHRFK